MAAAEQGNASAVKRRDLLQGQLSAAQVDEARRRRAELGTFAPARPGPAPAEPIAPASPPEAPSPAEPPAAAPQAEEPK
jgi:hypothetical protein